MTETKDFHIGDILSVLSQKIVSPQGVEGLIEILGWIANDNLHEAPPARAVALVGDCGKLLASQHPDLAQVAVPGGTNGSSPTGAVAAWLDEQVLIYGETRPVARPAPGDHWTDGSEKPQHISPDTPAGD